MQKRNSLKLTSVHAYCTLVQEHSRSDLQLTRIRTESLTVKEHCVLSLWFSRRCGGRQEVRHLKQEVLRLMFGLTPWIVNELFLGGCPVRNCGMWHGVAVQYGGDNTGIFTQR